ncbi:MAG: RluA family pseudouridine synthase [Desulfobacterales bacterium]|nr:RluA family pseudouridine synthase [Desulfobacterales bacterium]
MNTKNETFSIHVVKKDDGKRLDHFLSTQLNQVSRTTVCDAIKQGYIRVNNTSKKPSYHVKELDCITGCLPERQPVLFSPEPIPLEILFEDDDILVINKPDGLVVHPAPGNYHGTLVNALLYHYPTLKGIGNDDRPGIVHRLDKHTTGAIIIAKNYVAHQRLSEYFKERQVKKKYLALVWGKCSSSDGHITLPIGRHLSDRKKMSVATSKPRHAETYWQVKKTLGPITLLEVTLLTGRTHQIRVHCSAMQHPIVGDDVYGYKTIPSHLINTNNPLYEQFKKIVTRQMLHAFQLGLPHPRNQQWMAFEAPIPQDMLNMIDLLEQASIISF